MENFTEYKCSNNGDGNSVKKLTCEVECETQTGRGCDATRDTVLRNVNKPTTYNTYTKN
jgi:hypothetical protein